MNNKERLVEVLKMDSSKEVEIARGLRKIGLPQESVEFWTKKISNGEIGGGGSASDEDTDYPFANQVAFNLEDYKGETGYEELVVGMKDLQSRGFIKDANVITYKESLKHGIVINNKMNFLEGENFDLNINQKIYYKGAWVTNAGLGTSFSIYVLVANLTDIDYGGYQTYVLFGVKTQKVKEPIKIRWVQKNETVNAWDSNSSTFKNQTLEHCFCAQRK